MESVFSLISGPLKYLIPILRYVGFYTLEIIKGWWWLIFTILLIKPFLYLYLFFIRERWFRRKVRYILLEIKIPKEVERPLKAMEEVMAGIHAIHDVFNTREVWIEGKVLLGLSFEIVSDGGDIHFYIRVPEFYRSIVESNIYAQYPDAEIFKVEDYVNKVPHNIPNKEWDLFGFDQINTNDNPYPIRTYKQFEEIVQTEEEKRIDPLAGFLEGMSTLGPGEQLWYQILATPIREEIPWRKEGLALVNKLVKRPGAKKQKSIIASVLDLLLRGKPPESQKEEEMTGPFISFPEMTLTPGEREVVKRIENKIAKFGYSCVVRFLYLGKREVFFKPKVRIPFMFFKEISTENMNGLKPWSRTMPKVKHPLFEKRRVYKRKRRLFRMYRMRIHTLYPRNIGRYVFNTEELATLYHFPGKTVAPTPGIERIEAKKKEPPITLPKE